MAVGAPLRRLARQLASEAVVLILAAAVLGLAISIWLAQFLRGMAFLQNAQWRDATLLDWRVLGSSGVFVLLLGGLVSLAPILGLRQLGIARSSRQIAARATLGQRIAGTAQIAIAATLGGVAVAFAWHIGPLMLAWPGYETRGIYAVPFNGATVIAANGVPSVRAVSSVDSARRREILLSLPGVTNVSISGMAPGLDIASMRAPMPHPDDPDQDIQVLRTLIDSHYVDILDLRLVHGRSPTDADSNVVLVNQSLARAAFGRDDVVGEKLSIEKLSMGLGGGAQDVNEIVGVLEDLSFEHPAAEVLPMAFLATGEGLLQSLALIESGLTAGGLREAIDGLVESGALEITVQDVVPLATVRSTLLANDRAHSYLTIGAAVLVVLLAAFGFYGTQRYLVAAGRREYAIRASLGGGPRSRGRLGLLRGLTLGLPGLVHGLPLAFIAVAWLRDDYVSPDISPLLVSLVAAALIAGMLVAASLGPAAQARRTEPAPLLRED
jgi:ABC-type antimicrobial peptide transport system permease subunit